MKKSLKFHLLLLLIAILGLSIRLIVAREIFAIDPLSSAPPSYTDMFTYQQLSEQIFDGKFNQSFYFQPFYYALFLPMVYLFLGKGIWNIILIQAILGSITIWLTGFSTALIRSRRTGIIASILMAISLMGTFYTSYLLIATLKTFLISLMMFSAILAFKKDRWYYWGLLALVCSFLVLTRANTLVFIPTIMLFSFFIREKHVFSPPLSPFSKFIKKTVPAILILFLFILPLLPFVYHNSSIEGKLTPPSTAGAANLAMGNNPEACPAGLSYTQTSKYWNRNAKEISIPTRILVWFYNNPLAVIELSFRKLMIFWDAGTIFDNISSFNKLRQDSKPLIFFPFLPTSLYLIGFLASVIAFYPKIIKNKKLLFPLSVIALYWLTTATFINLSRYRIVMIPIFSVFTAVFIDKLIHLSHKTPKLIKLIFVFLLCTGWVFGAYPFYRFYLEKHIFALIQPNGNRIDLGTDKLYFDNGPRNMGSWTTFPLVPGNPISKTFAIEDKDISKNAELHLQLFCKNKKPMQININGEPFSNIPKQGKMIFKFRIIVPQDGKIIIEPKIVQPGEVFAFCDLQRNYQRTSVNEKALNGELVCRLIVDRTPEKTTHQH